MRRLSVAVVVMSALILVTFHAAAAFRCGNKLVSVGDTKSEVLNTCGQPNWVDSWEEERLFRGTGQALINKGQNFGAQVPVATLIRVTIEEWTYNLGPTQFIRILRFENGRLRDIETGDYGN